MNKIIVYEEKDFEGFRKEFTCSVPDLRTVDFGDCISSLKVIGQPWLVFRDPNYKGVGFAYEEGEHKHIQLSNNISSIQLVTEDLEDPQITLYEHPNYEGISKVIKEETNLSYGYFNDKASSHIVQKGAWLLYEHPRRGGWYYIAREGTKLDNYGPLYHFHDKCSHVYPLKSGRPVITSRILWDRKNLESERDVMIDEINCINSTETEQTFTTTSSRTYEMFTSHSFKLAVPNLQINESFNLSIDPSTNLTVEKGKIDSITTVNKVEVTMPAKVPPKSELSIQVIMKVATFSVPVELIITNNGKSRTEIGQYRSVSGRNIITKYSMKSVKN
ncbi:epidermal differentiation-specific protein-like [Lacerta agilis]|uniref:epidermal differentiation-specific protein-like n=1 Tax=Lacerta agilis TaxID=80427 RepID=UPI0014194B7C|nr:epidermal differentiation-specific protein-like [Lacerta agilis]XP_032996445.1 epidermal differentiation-specific protein-like [Lacerta agilis]